MFKFCIDTNRIGAKIDGSHNTKIYAMPIIYPARGNSQAEFMSLYLPAIYKGIC